MATSGEYQLKATLNIINKPLITGIDVALDADCLRNASSNEFRFKEFSK